MAQVDTSIYGNLLRPAKSVEEYDQEAQQAKSNKLALLLQQGQYDAQQQAAKRQSALTSLLQSGADSNALRQHGYLKEAADWDQSAAKANQDNAQAESYRATAKKTGIEAQAKKAELYRDQLPMISSPQQAAQWLAASYNDPDIGTFLQSAGRLEDVVSKIPEDPQGFADWKLQAAEGVGKFADMLIERRKQAEVERSNRVDEGIARGNLSVAQGNLGQRQREFSYQQGKDAQDRKDKQAAPQAGSPTQRVQDATDAIGLIDMASGLVDKATGSYAGVAADETARFFGKATPGAEAAAQLKAIEGMLISKMPKMSGPQSDKDVLLYKQMAGQVGDPTIPASQKKAALSTIRRIQENYGGKSGGASGSWDGSGAGGKPSVSNW